MSRNRGPNGYFARLAARPGSTGLHTPHRPVWAVAAVSPHAEVPSFGAPPPSPGPATPPTPPDPATLSATAAWSVGASATPPVPPATGPDATRRLPSGQTTPLGGPPGRPAGTLPEHPGGARAQRDLSPNEPPTDDARSTDTAGATAASASTSRLPTTSRHGGQRHAGPVAEDAGRPAARPAVDPDRSLVVAQLRRPPAVLARALPGDDAPVGPAANTPQLDSGQTEPRSSDRSRTLQPPPGPDGGLSSDRRPALAHLATSARPARRPQELAQAGTLVARASLPPDRRTAIGHASVPGSPSSAARGPRQLVRIGAIDVFVMPPAPPPAGDHRRTVSSLASSRGTTRLSRPFPNYGLRQG